MNRLILLDSGPLGVAANPRASADTLALNGWIHAQTVSGTTICVPDIADYEVRRELIRANKTTSLARLDSFSRRFLYLPVTTQVLRRAAELWAQARNMGKPTAHALSLDADVIIAAQALLLLADGDEVIVATTNPKHLALFVPADLWQNIQ